MGTRGQVRRLYCIFHPQILKNNVNIKILKLRNNFFDGLKQFGRDFGKIKTYMSVKAGKDSSQFKVCTKQLNFLNFACK